MLMPQSGNGGRNIALLGALCLFLSAIDHLIPKPLPFMRIGLANLPLLIALGVFPVQKYFLLALVKVLGQALITGTLFSYVIIFSLAGTALSAVTMLLLYRWTSLVGTSIAGAFVSNAVQLVLARFIVFGEGALYLAPPFLMAGIISGALLGFFARAFCNQSEWLRLMREKNPNAETHSANITPPEKTVIHPRYIALFVLGGFFLLVPSLAIRAALFVFFWVLVIVTGKKSNPVVTIVSIALITLCNLFPPFGKILFRIGPFIIAEGNLLRGLQRAVTMEGLIMFSKLAISAIPPLPGTIGSLLRESLCLLERMNRLFFDKEELKNRNDRKDKEKILKKLDRVLCEISGS